MSDPSVSPAFAILRYNIPIRHITTPVCRKSKGATAGEDPVAQSVPGKQGWGQRGGEDKEEYQEEEEEEEEVDEFDQMDAEEREEAFSGTSHTVSWREARTYLFAVLTAR